MAVTCTKNPRMLRVTYTAFEDEELKREVICYVEPDDDGQITIYYSHNQDSQRVDAKSPWGAPREFILELSNRVLVSEINVNVLSQLHGAFGFRVMPLTRAQNVAVGERGVSGEVKFHG